jgi:hypothetical protein
MWGKLFQKFRLNKKSDSSLYYCLKDTYQTTFYWVNKNYFRITHKIKGVNKNYLLIVTIIKLIILDYLINLLRRSFRQYSL